MEQLNECKNLLCVRLDNMGDVLMSSPAINALKETFNCRITLLTSTAGSLVSEFIPSIDDVIVYDVPWVKGNAFHNDDLTDLIREVRDKAFDAAIIFTVFSQNPLPSAMITYLAGIPVRVAYCRENPYHLLTHWVAEQEPYTFVRHQVKRDIDLAKSIGAVTQSDEIIMKLENEPDIHLLLQRLGLNPNRQWIILHPGVSEKKRRFPVDLWVKIATMLTERTGCQLLITGSEHEKDLAEGIAREVGEVACSAAGTLTLKEFITVIRHAPLVISVNTSTTHIAAATQTPLIVLYALTNPQHTPWKAWGKIFLFDVPPEDRSKNEILNFVRNKYYPEGVPMVIPEEVVEASLSLLAHPHQSWFTEIISLREHLLS